MLKLKLKLVKVDYLLCDSNVANCEEALVSFMLNLTVAHDLITMLVEQVVQKKSRASPYFEPL
jgi:hypothetical protein